MLQRVNWPLLFGVFFMVIGIIFLFTSRWLDAAWNMAMGTTSLFVAYGQKHPEINRGWLGWTLTIILVVILAALTILRLTTA